MQGRVALALLGVFGSLAPCSVVAVSPKPLSWQLGRGFTATVYASARVPGSSIAERTLLIQRRGRTWRRFSRQDEGLGVEVGDISGDGVKDVLVLDFQGGSGACGVYRLFGGPWFGELWRRSDCADTGIVRLAGGALVAWRAVLSSQTSATRGQIHCCWAAWRRTEWRWRAGKLVRVRSSIGRPPPARWRKTLLPDTYPRR
jgi:hypothetical protein